MTNAVIRAALAEVTVVIVAYNSRAALQRQWSQLCALPHITVVDNASADGTAEWLREALPQAKVLRQQKNIGFGRGHNLAVSQCSTAFALLLNPDCVIEAEALARLVACLQQHPEALLAVPGLVYADGRAQENHRAFFNSRGRERPDYQLPQGELCCEMVSGAVLLVRTELFRRIGGFDPWFFLYWEDEELCLRARRLRLAVILAPQATACHVAQSSSPPTVRTIFIRHYCYTVSKLYLRRQLGEGMPLLVLRALGTLLPSLFALLVSLVIANRPKAVRSAARAVAVMTAPWQLRRSRSVPLPSQLWRQP